MMGYFSIDLTENCWYIVHRFYNRSNTNFGVENINVNNERILVFQIAVNPHQFLAMQSARSQQITS